MNILALETSTAFGSVAALDSGVLLGQQELPPHQTTAQTLAPAIRAQLSAVGWTPPDVDLIATSVGPGSFTGLRIAVTTAKTLAYATGAQVIGLDTLEVIADQAPSITNMLHVILDAQRQQLYVARFGQDASGRLQTLESTRIVPLDEWLSTLAPPATLSGPAVAKISHRLPTGIELVQLEYRIPQAKTVGRLGYDYFVAGRRADLWGLVPRYYRRSAAEEKWEQRPPESS